MSESANSYHLLNGVLMNGLHPDSFFIPTEEEKGILRIGDVVKLGFKESGKNLERMWVIITQVGNCDTFTGVLDNVPFHLTSVKCGDVVRFDERHILDIFNR